MCLNKDEIHYTSFRTHTRTVQLLGSSAESKRRSGREHRTIYRPGSGMNSCACAGHEVSSATGSRSGGTTTSPAALLISPSRFRLGQDGLGAREKRTSSLLSRKGPKGPPGTGWPHQAGKR